MASPAHSALLPPGSGLALLADARSCPGTDEFLGAHQATTDFFLGRWLVIIVFGEVYHAGISYRALRRSRV